jgi:hypothetical protein
VAIRRGPSGASRLVSGVVHPAAALIADCGVGGNPGATSSFSPPAEPVRRRHSRSAATKRSRRDDLIADPVSIAGDPG